MKLTRNLLGALLAASLLSAPAAPAAGAEGQTALQPLRLLAFEGSGQASPLTAETGIALLRRTDGQGTRGVACAQFTAPGGSVLFRVTQAPGVSRYYAQLYRGPIGDDAAPVTDWGGADGVQLGWSVAADGLSVGETYHFKISGYDGSQAGITAKWALETYAAPVPAAEGDADPAPAEPDAAVLAEVFGDRPWSLNGDAWLVAEDGGRTPVPKFSEVFPAWDYDALFPAAPDESGADGGALAQVRFCRPVDLLAPDRAEPGEPFYRFNANGSAVYVKALTLPAGMTSFSVTLADEADGRPLLWLPSLTLGQEAALPTRYGARYSVRAASGVPGVSGYGMMSVTQVPGFTLDDLAFDP